MVKVKLDGKIIEVEKGTKIAEVLKGKSCFAALMNSRLVDLTTPINSNCEIEIVDFSSEKGKEIFWHSTSHIMAMAVKMLYPDVKLAIGPAIDDGFYYDFDSNKPITAENLAKIEEKMKYIIEKNVPFERTIMKKEAVVEFFSRRNETYKVELAKELNDTEISLYRNGDFVDLCLGPHISRTGTIGAFKLLTVAGAYWHGDSRLPMLSRIYGISFPTQTELDEHLKKLEEAARRDHRRLGAELELFTIFDTIGAGLVTWFPKGNIIKRMIEEYWVKKHIEAGYQIVSTPHIARSDLWRQSGHYDYYRDKMYTMPVENEEYVLKPMNCPAHILIYKSRVRSYKELPVRLTEMGTVYRNELSGTLHGLLRVRGFTIDDAHIFCVPEQVNEELVRVIQLAQSMLKKFGFDRYQVELSVWDPHEKKKYLGTEKDWEKAEAGLTAALNAIELPYKRMVGEAAFYGPKVDIKILDAIGRAWQATTIQFDFNLPKKFDITYMDRNGAHKEVVVIHRAIYGSIERFIGTLIEHYGGAFPAWLAPVQAVIMPITDKEGKYAKEVFSKCIKQGLRVEINDKSEKINYRIREAEVKKVPYIIVLGTREMQSKTVSVRKRSRGNIGEMKLKDFFNLLDLETGGDN